MNIFHRVSKKVSKKNLKIVLAIVLAFLLFSTLGIYLYRSNVLIRLGKKASSISDTNYSKDISSPVSSEEAKINIQKINKIVSEKMRLALEQMQPDLIYKKYSANPLIEIKLSGLKNRSRGSKNPKHKMVVFTDFACSICSRVSAELKQRLEENKNRLEIVYVLFPLDKKCNASLKGKYSNYSCFSAELALCAEKEGKFFESFDYLYKKRPSKTTVIDENVFISQMSKELKLKDLNNCMTSGWLKKRMVSENNIYKNIKIPGTPYIFLDGRQLNKIYRFKESFSDFLDYKELKTK